ncbi:MAG: hypothetical protein AB7O97_17350 [Planctomycetota bacterium]
MRTGPGYHFRAALITGPSLAGPLLVSSRLLEHDLVLRFAGGRWSEIPTSGRQGDTEPTAVFDLLRQRVVQFGGSRTWALSGDVWTELAVGAGPPARGAHAMAYDFLRDRVVLFGGVVGGLTLFDDTWEFDGVAWSQVQASGPSARALPAMAFAPGLGTVLVGGDDLGQGLGDTWVFAGGTWQQLAANVPRRLAAGLAYDATRSSLLLYGGVRRTQAFGIDIDTETWELAGGSWIQRATTGPSAQRPAMATDWVRGGAVMYAEHEGELGAGALYHWNGSAWVSLEPGPLFGRSLIGVAFDTARDRLVLLGGHQGSSSIPDTFEWYGDIWHRVPTTAQPARGVPLVYDARRQRVVAADGTELWSFDGIDWTVATTATAVQGVVLYDTLRGEVIGSGAAGLMAFDGTDWRPLVGAQAPGAVVHRTSDDRLIAFNLRQRGWWQHHGTTWLPMPTLSHAPAMVSYVPQRGLGVVSLHDPSPAWAIFDGTQNLVPRSCQDVFALVTDAGSGRTFGVQGTGAVYELEWPDAGFLARYGTGCAGSGGVPVLEAPGVVQPQLGRPLPLTVRALPAPPGTVVLIMGLELALGGGMPLDAVGVPGCPLWTTPLATAWFAHPGRRLDWAPVLPASAALVGVSIVLQPFVFDAAAGNGIGATGNAVLVNAR